MSDQNNQDTLDGAAAPAPVVAPEDDFEASFAAALEADSSVDGTAAGLASNDTELKPDAALAAAPGTQEPSPAPGAALSDDDADAASSSQGQDDFAKREHALKSTLGRQIADLKRQLEAAKTSPTPVVVHQQPAEESAALDLTALRAEYSELNPLFDTVEKMNAQLNALKQPINQIAVSQQQQAFDAQYSIYTSAHSDFGEFNPNHEQANSEKLEAFAAWAQQQPKAVQEMIHRTNNAETFDGQEAAYVLKQFKQDAGFGQSASELRPTPKPALSAVREKQLGAAIAVPTGSQRPAVSQVDPDDFIGGFNLELQRELARTNKR